MSVNTALARPGCGCGSGGSGGCGCGGTGTADLAATSFVRPRFFSGQLLTEDDLSTLTAYTTAKDRLHNRYLFGAGVVCGLWVSCDPCGGGTVTVQPGYALDCCGNDLLLPCTATLDVNAMIRDLRAAQLGKDCGDPCADQGTGSSGRQNTAVSRHYSLYARYGEQATDPVAPYATGEPCGQVACEPTRIREGISFVLKCPADTPPPDDLCSRIRGCLPSQEILRREERLEAYSGPMTAAVHAAEHPPPFTAQDADELTKLRAELAEARRGAGDEQIRSATECVRRLAAVLARYDLARQRAEYADIRNARSELRDAAVALTRAGAAARYGPLDRPAVHALLEQATRLAEPSGLPHLELSMLAQGRPLDDAVLAALTSDAGALQEWLLDRLDNDPTLADCDLRSLAKAISVTTSATVDAPSLRSLGGAGSQLAELLARTVTDCICAALDPPCTPCEDTDVLLACLEVRDCTVVRICNAERDYVISGSALRYWLPSKLLHRGVEWFCCRPGPRRDAPPAETGRLAFSEAGFVAGEPVAAMPWELLGLPDPDGLLRDVMERVGAARAVPAVPQPPTAASQAAAEATAEQIADLAARVAALTEQLTRTQAKLGETDAKVGETEAKLGETEAKLGETEANLRVTQADLGKTQASLSALGSRPPAQASQTPPRTAAARQMSPGEASARRRNSAAKRPAAEKPASPADSGGAAAGSGASETSDDT